MEPAPSDVVLWTKYEYTLTLRAGGEGAAQTCVVTWKPDGGVDGTATLDRWGPDGAAVALTPDQCRVAQAGLERLAEAMREQAATGSFGEPSLGVVYVDTTVHAAPPEPPKQQAPAPVPSVVPQSTVPSRRSRSSSRSRSRSGSSSPAPRRHRRHRHHHRRPTPSPSPPAARPRRSPSASPGGPAPAAPPVVTHTARSALSGAGSATTTTSQPRPAPVPAVTPEDAVAPPKPRAKRATVSVRAAPLPKRGAMAAQNQQWQNAWNFGTLPGAAP